MRLGVYITDMIICKLKAVLKSKGWTRYELRKRSGVTYPTLLALYRNTSKGYRADVLDKLCYALMCQPGDLLKWQPQRFPRIKRRKR
jgi:putative transcriptional regulator